MPYAEQKRDRLHQFITSLVELGTKQLADELQIPPQAANAAMSGVARSLCSLYARTEFYVPAALHLELAGRDKAIWDAFHQPGPDGVRACSGERTRQLAHEHQLTTVHVYRILRRMRFEAKRAAPGKSERAGHACTAEG